MINNVLNFNTWLRILYSFLYGFALCLISYIVFAVIVIQFIVVLLKGETCPKLVKFGGQLGAFITAAIAYLTFKSDEKPFPFADWPKE